MHVIDQTQGQKSCYKWLKIEGVNRKVNRMAMVIDEVFIDQGHKI